MPSIECESPATSHLHDRISNINRQLSDIETRIDRVTVAVCGTCPAECEELAKPMSESIHDKLDATIRYLHSISSELTRLENTVGSANQKPQQASVVGRSY